MTLTQITMTIGRTLNTGDYNSVRVEITHTLTLDPGDLEARGMDELHATARNAILDQMVPTLTQLAQVVPNRANTSRR